MLNFCSYSNQLQESLSSIFTDVDGKKRHATMLRGKVRLDIWNNQLVRGTQILPDPLRDVISKIAERFVQATMGYHSPRVSLCDRRLLLVGDAQTLFRPPIASSTDQAAFDCLCLES